jgi:hypothetical protein
MFVRPYEYAPVARTHKVLKRNVFDSQFSQTLIQQHKQQQAQYAKPNL